MLSLFKIFAQVRKPSVACAIVFVWMSVLEWISTYGQGRANFDLQRLKNQTDLVEPNLGAFVETPHISLYPIYFKAEDLPKELRLDKDNKSFEEIMKLRTDGHPDKAYLKADQFITKNRNSPL